MAHDIRRHLPAETYPHLAEMIIEHARQPDDDSTREFDFGTDLIPGGLEARSGDA